MSEVNVPVSNKIKNNSQSSELAAKTNWLRAGVLGANDGIVSVAGVLLGVAGAALSARAIFISGLAATLAGALAMSAGEYVSVSTQRDTEKAELEREAQELNSDPQGKIVELSELLQARGIEANLAHDVAAQLSEHDAIGAHARFGLGIEADELTNPWAAALASLVAFFLGAMIPVLFMVLTPAKFAVPVTMCAVTVALGITGFISAHLGNAPKFRPTLRNVVGGLIAMGVTYLIGAAVGMHI